MYNGRKDRIVATIEARMTSSRFPGKVMKPVAGKPVLEFMIERLRRSRYLDDIIIATTTNKDDDIIEDLAHRIGVGIFRGSESDVMGRVLGAANSARADVIMETMADTPFIDPELVDRGIEEFYLSGVDYAANCLIDTYAVGFEVQVFPIKILADAASRTDDIVDRTHVSYYIYKHPELYRSLNWEAPPELRAPEFRMTLDEESDYLAITKVADALYPVNPDFGAKEVTEYLRSHPEVAMINKGVRQKAAEEL